MTKRYPRVLVHKLRQRPDLAKRKTVTMSKLLDAERPGSFPVPRQATTIERARRERPIGSPKRHPHRTLAVRHEDDAQG
jgi:hypothetical protein